MTDDHLPDHALSALIDDDTGVDSSTHLTECVRCQGRLRELRSVVEMLRSLPEVEPPRSFVLGPRSAAASAGGLRVRRWYVATRALSASLAAVFVVLVGGATYLDLSVAPPSQPTGQVAQPAVAPPPEGAQPAAASPPPRAASAPAIAPRAQAQRAAAPAADESTPSTDQVIATTAVRPLPTLTPVRLPPPVAAVVREAPAGDPGAPLRVAASVVGVLAVLSLLGTFVLRHRLRAA